MRLSYTRWYVLRELARGRVLVFFTPLYGSRTAALAGKGRPLEDIPLSTATSIQRGGLVKPCTLPVNPDWANRYTAWDVDRPGWEEAERVIFGTHEFWSWFGGSYGFSKKRTMELMMDLRGQDRPFSYSLPTLKEWANH